MYTTILSLPNYQTLYLFLVHISLPDSKHTARCMAYLCDCISTLKYSATFFSTILMNPERKLEYNPAQLYQASEQNTLNC